MKGKPQRIDLMHLRTQGGTKSWNEFLTKCTLNNDLDSLCKVLYGIQLGMDQLVKDKLNTDEISLWFIRLQKSLEDTMKRVMKNRKPHPLDSPYHKSEDVQFIDSKRKRDEDIERFLRKVRY